MPLHFLTDDAAAADVDSTVVLTGAEAHHAAVVRRVRPGEGVTLGDGRGAWLEAVVTDVAPKSVAVTVRARRDVPAATPRIVLAQALAKSDRDELAVQAATELGVDAIIPWQASRSVSRWDAVKAEKGIARWQSIAREAAKQAHRAWVPEVQPAASTARLVEWAATCQVVVLEPSATEALSTLAIDGRDVLLVVGPEGGIAPDELSRLQDAGAAPVRLGGTVLRTSTAGPAAIAVASVALGRW